MLQDIISLLGIANPQLSLTWQDTGTLTEDPALPMRLSGTPSKEWLAPASGIFNKDFASRLTMPNGFAPAADTWVLSIDPQVFLRLSRIYGLFLEGRTVNTDKPQRPVPKFFAFHNTSQIGTDSVAGNRGPGDRLGVTGGSISVHDQTGRPIDALSVVSVFVTLMTNFPALAAKPFASAASPSISASQLGSLGSGLTAPEVRVRIMTLHQKPFVDGNTKLTNLTPVDPANGIYKVDNPNQPILIVIEPGNLEQHLAVGPATFGTISDSFSIHPLSVNVPLSVLKRDFLSLYADDLNAHLRGLEAAVAPFEGVDFRIPTYHNESISLHTNGNQLTARAGQILATSAGLSLVVSPVISDDFELAPSAEQADWPVFPPGGDGAIPGRLNDLKMTAHFLSAPDDVRDVFLKIEIPEKKPGEPQVASGTAIRIYNRKMLADAREGRGSGAGGTLQATSIGFRLANPFQLRNDDVLPTSPHLSFDLVAVNRSGKKRSFGLLATIVDGERAMDSGEAALASRGANSFNAATERGISPAGLLGLPAQRLNTLGSVTDVESAVNVALSLGDESQPRNAPRLPLMTRNETIIAGRDSSGTWSAELCALWLRRDSRSGFHRLGSPGSPGGEEFLGAGASTSKGLLAYDLARAAFRRARGLASRLDALGNDNRWQRPIVAAPSGTFSAALLQDIAPGADSPNLKLIPDAAFSSLPQDWTSLVNGINGILPAGLASNAQLRNMMNSLASSAQGLELYSEFRREAVTARFGRRDSRDRLIGAIKEASDLIYIESPAFSFTDYLDNDPSNPENPNDPPNPEHDLISLIANQLANRSGLKVLIGVSKEFLSGKGYETFAARAYDRRKKALEKLRAIDPDRVALFHPIGFPGRPVRLMSNIVIVDDIWLFIGSGSLTRRGLLFDGNLSLVLFDREIEAGRSKAISSFRRELLNNHLGVLPIPGKAPDTFVPANRTRTADLHESFFAMRDLLKEGGAGLVESVWDGSVTGQTPIAASSFPHRDLADPDGMAYATSLAALLQLFAGLGDADA